MSTTWYIVILERLNPYTGDYDLIQCGSFISRSEAELAIENRVNSGYDPDDLSIKILR